MSVQRACRSIVEQHGGNVPADLETLTRIKGVGRKTAAVVVGEAFGRPAIAVDTHVKRVSTRLGLARGKTPEKIEKELCAVIPRDRWTRATKLIGTHGRRICTARRPDHEGCPVSRLCDYYIHELGD
jgi:endonuclease-3